jgi:hypothetical protein
MERSVSEPVSAGGTGEFAKSDEARFVDNYR